MGGEQGWLFGKPREAWEEVWDGMPDFVQEDLAPVDSAVYELPDGRLYVHFTSRADATAWGAKVQAVFSETGKRPEELGREGLSKLLEQDLDVGKKHDERRRTQSVWWPEAEIGRFAGKAYTNVLSLPEEEARLVEERGVLATDRKELDLTDVASPPEINPVPLHADDPRRPKYPILIPTKGRYETRYTARALDRLGLEYVEVVEPQERDLYLRAGAREDRLLVLPFSDRGLVPTRNWIWDYAEESGADRFWTMDDNIQGFYRLHYNLKTPVADGTIIRTIEDCVDRYENVGVAGMNYFMFASRKTAIPPLYVNGRVYSNMLLPTRLRELDGRPFRNEGTFNDDTDLNLRILKPRPDERPGLPAHSYGLGMTTLLFNAFLVFKSTTMSVKGGIGYVRSEKKEEDQRWIASNELAQKHPDVARVTEKWGRWHHHVDYAAFRHNKLVPRSDFEPAPEDSRDNRGMILRIVTPPEKESRKKEPMTETEIIFSAPPPNEKPLDEIPDLSRVDEVALDFETTGLRWWKEDRPVGVGVAWRSGNGIESRYLPFAHAGGNLPEERVREFVRSLRGKRILAHSAKFDFHMAREWDADLEGSEIRDTMILSALLDDGRWTNKLDSVAEDYLGEGKVRGVNLSRGAGIFHSSQVAEYGRRDVELVLRLDDVFAPMIEDQGLSAVAELEADVIWATIEMERNGFPIDVALLEEWDRDSARDLERAETKLGIRAGFRVNVDSPTDMERLFTERGIAIDERTKSGLMSIAGSVIREAAERDPVVALAREVAKLRDLRSKFLGAYPEQVSDDGRMRYSLNQIRGEGYGTISGRFSGSAAAKAFNEGCNPQQVLSDEKARKLYGDRYAIRRLWIPGDGILVAADASQVELRIFAHYANSPALLEAYARDPRTDFHQVVTEIAQRYNDELTRKLVKNLNFALLFGAGLKKTAEMMGVSVDDARKFRGIYQRAFPEAKQLLDLAMRRAESVGFVRTILGRRARFPRAERTHKALNAVIQGSNGDYHKLKLKELYDARKRLGLTLRLTVHDEIVGDVPDENAAKEVHALLERQTLPLRIPLLWDYGVGANWSEAK